MATTNAHEPEDSKASYDSTYAGNGDTKDVEKGPDNELKRRYTSHSDDPFGDESNAQVKYKVLEWW